MILRFLIPALATTEYVPSRAKQVKRGVVRHGSCNRCRRRFGLLPPCHRASKRVRREWALCRTHRKLFITALAPGCCCCGRASPHHAARKFKESTWTTWNFPRNFARCASSRTLGSQALLVPALSAQGLSRLAALPSDSTRKPAARRPLQSLVQGRASRYGRHLSVACSRHVLAASFLTYACAGRWRLAKAGTHRSPRTTHSRWMSGNGLGRSARARAHVRHVLVCACLCLCVSCSPLSAHRLIRILFGVDARHTLRATWCTALAAHCAALRCGAAPHFTGLLPPPKRTVRQG
jgi:hypothetical protein